MTNPDTNTLNGALEQLGITIAENLVTQGVTDADPSDGLTTLANKILDITPGPGPTPTPASIDLTATSSILSYADSDSTVLTATVLDSSDNPVSGATVELYKDSVLWDTLTTDSSGEVSKTYTSAGVGDLTFCAKCNLVTESFVVQDCSYFNDGTSTAGITMSSGVSVTIDNGALKITTSTSGEKYVHLPVSMANSDNFIFEFEIARSGSTQHFACFVNSASAANGLWWAYDNSASRYVGRLTGTSLDKSGGISVGDVLKYKQENGVVTLYHNNSVMNSKSSTFSTSPFGMGYYTNYGRVQYLKNIKVKPL